MKYKKNVNFTFLGKFYLKKSFSYIFCGFVLFNLKYFMAQNKNKFEKDIMENSFQNMRNDKRKTAEKSTMVNNMSPETQNEALENVNKKTLEHDTSQNQVSNENSILDIPEEKSTTTEKELPLNIDLSDNENAILSP